MNVEMLRRRYLSFVWLAGAAALVALVLVAVMARAFATQEPDPLTDPSYVALKEALSDTPDDDALRSQLRQLDLELRRSYFQRRQFIERLTYLLLITTLIGLASAKAAATLHRRLPHPKPATELPTDPVAHSRLQGLWAVAGLAVVLIATTIGLGVGLQSLVTEDLIAAHQPGDSPSATAGETTGRPGEGAITKPAVPEFAPWDAMQEQWPRFRGPSASGITKATAIPTKWDASDGTGILWKTEIPLPGNNSPVLWNDRIFVTGADEKVREVYCIDAANGNLLWQKTAPDPDPGREPIEVSEDTGYAASTPVTDGIRVYAVFATGDVGAWDYEGNNVWFRTFGPLKNPYGHASSLALYENRLIVQLDQGTKDDGLSKIMALDTATGETQWETAREVPASWSTPVVFEHDEGVYVVTCGDPWVIAYQVADGKEVWRCKALRQDVGPSPIVGLNMIFAANEFPGVTAIRLGGQGDVSDTHKVWESDWGAPDTTSPLLVGKLLLMMASYGTLTCYDAEKGGDPLWEQDFDDNFMSSPSLAENRVYLFGESGKCWIAEVTAEQCETIAENDLGEECVTSPAFEEGRIYIRGEEHVFCLGASNESE